MGISKIKRKHKMGIEKADAKQQIQAAIAEANAWVQKREGAKQAKSPPTEPLDHIRFSQADMALFAKASGDTSPLHTDPIHCRQTPFGEPLVYGGLGALACLGQLNPQLPIQRMEIAYLSPFFVDVGYRVQCLTQDETKAEATLCDGDLVLVRLQAFFGEANALVGKLQPITCESEGELRKQSPQFEWSQYDEDLSDEGRYQTDHPAIASLRDRFDIRANHISDGHLDGLAYFSYLSGMVLPGYQSMSSQIRIDFGDFSGDRNYVFQAKNIHFDHSYGLLSVATSLCDGKEIVAKGELKAFARKSMTPIALDSLVPSDGQARDFHGKVALVTGGSRGLGEALVKTLSLRGASVILGYQTCSERAQSILQDLGKAAERVSLRQGDVSDPEWCDQTRAWIQASFGRLDMLFCNAVTPAQPIGSGGIEAKTRAQTYVTQNLALTRSPSQALLPLLNEHQGTLIVISDEQVGQDSEPNPYLDMKRQLESWLTSFTDSQKELAALLVRPPKMCTDLSNRPSASMETTAPATIALGILNALTEVKPGQTHTVRPSDLINATGSKPGSVKPVSTIDPLVISATFTAEPIEPALQWLLDQFELPFQIEWAPYNQLFQELLNPESLTQRNEKGVKIMFLRFEDWLRNLLSEDNHSNITKAPGYTKALREYLERTLADFLSALKAYASRSTSQTLILYCPSGEAYQKHPTWHQLFAKMLQDLVTEVQGLTDVDLMETASFEARFGHPEVFDLIRDEIGHIPFSKDYFYMLANLVCRRLYAWRSNPYKVIVLDCDNTLWKGVCGEVGAGGISFAGHFDALQSFLVEQAEKGMVLCLASKNVEEDVWNVFDQRPDMRLKREHIVDSRINWMAKSSNIIEMAQSLNLSLDSFIFIDDNPVEVAEVRANAPEVFVIQWPATPRKGQRILDHNWIFDHYNLTGEDKQRTQMYQTNIERETLLNKSSNFENFITSLELNIDVALMTAATLPRLTQLTNRTNQFNFTTIRRTENQVAKQSKSGSHEFWTVTVSDRFGEYGLVGVMILAIKGKILEVDSFMLSCRVLGRGVPFRMLAHIGAVAVAKGLEQVHVRYLRTAKNLPAKNFIDGVGKDYAHVIDDDTVTYHFPAKTLSELRWKPKKIETGKQASKQTATKAAAILTTVRNREKQMMMLTQELADPPTMAAQIADMAKSTATKGTSIQKVVVPTPESHPKPPANTPKIDLLRHAVLADVKAIFAKSLDLEVSLLAEDEPLETYVNDSFKNVEITVELKKHFPNVAATVLFEHRNMGAIADAFIGENAELLAAQYPSALDEPETSEDLHNAGKMPAEPRVLVPTEERQDGPGASAIADRGDIAIIGVAGIYPGAPHPEALWEILVEGRSVIDEVPAERWDMNAIFGAKGEPDKSYCKWGGFIKDVDKFDPSFFQITPKEIEVMDPQQRLMLQVAWNLIEDAGYTRQTMARETGVFVAVVSNDYGNFANEAAMRGQSAYRWTDYYQIPNRISYYFDFQGPSLAIDTACSGAGTALHLACQTLKKGDIKTAIVGGVNLFLHPSRFVQYSQMQMLTDEPYCRPFGKGANGTLFGEGIGALMLKPLTAAESDGDHIYAVIKATSINSGGKTNGFTVPNPQAHSALITKAFQDSGIDPRTISYMEAHGTGTSLGDPIEIRGLTMAYKENADPRYGTLPNQYCSIGSLKANIGHLESVAAISSITKVLLQMKHRQLVPSLNASETNPLIDFANTPFLVQQETKPWERPIISIDGQSVSIRRRAAVSSFGAGGSNAHVILEEYVAPTSEADPGSGPWVIILSAKTQSALTTGATRLAKFLEQIQSNLDCSNPINLEKLAYTLQVGREAMSYRLAIVVTDVASLIKKLAVFAQGKKAGQVFEGHARKDKVAADLLIAGDEGLTFLQLLIQNRKLEKLAQLWVAGVNIQWDLIWGPHRPKRMSLPTYSFEGESYWLPQTDATKLSMANHGRPVLAQLHPLISRNVSTLEAQGYAQIFNGEEFVLDHHIVSGEKVLPAVAYLEMARVAGNLAHPKCRVHKLRNIVWAQRYAFQEDSPEVSVNLIPHDDSITYQVCTQTPQAKPIVHTSGKILYQSPALNPAESESIDIDKIRERCPDKISHEHCYKLYRGNGFDYGPGFKPIVEMVHNDQEALAVLVLPEEVSSDFNRYLLHPTLMDGALQTVIGLTGQTVALSHTPWLPFGLGEIEIFRPLQKKCFAYVKLASNLKSGNAHIKKFDILLTDEDGQVLVHMKEYSLRAVPEYQRVLHLPDDPQATSTLYYRDEWKDMPVRQFNQLGETPGLKDLGHLLIFDTSKELTSLLRTRLTQADYGHIKVSLVLPGEGYAEKGDGIFEIASNRPSDYRQLLDVLQAQNRLPKQILHLWSKGRFVLEKAVLEAQLQRGAYSVFTLSQALIERKIRDDVRLIYVFGSHPDHPQPQYAAVSGLARTIHIENGKLHFKTIELQTNSQESIAVQTQASLLLTEMLIWTGKALEIRYQGTQRFAKYLQEFDLAKTVANERDSSNHIGLRKQATYLITGGLGGLGKLFADFLARQYGANLVLAGRSELNESGHKALTALQEQGSAVIYVPTDVGNREQVQELVAKARQRFGSIDGVIHAAGIIRDGFVLKKSAEDFRSVLVPKVYGSLFLDEATRDEGLDFFVMFSSLTSLIGNIGQADYAYANRFMDAYATYRQELVRNGKRSGKSLAINWPFWKEGGMRVDQKAEKALTDTMGMRALETELGIGAFQQGLAFPGDQFLIVEGAFQKVRKALRIAVLEEERKLNQAKRFQNDPPTVANAKPAPKTPATSDDNMDPSALKLQTETFLKEVLANETKLPLSKIIADEPLEEYGIDSVMILTLSSELEKVFGELSKTLLFEYQSIAELTDYFLEHHRAKLLETFQVTPSDGTKRSDDVKVQFNVEEPSLEMAGLHNPRFLTGKLFTTEGQPPADEDIAIIGVSGRYPGARNLAEYWENLRTGRDCIEEIPRDRWDWRDNYNPDKNAYGKTYSKWGGFLDGVADFDSVFFNISPKEAALIDPQERLFLEASWQALEDSGYTRGSFGKTSVGVYVGVMWGHYQLYGPQEAAKGNIITPDSSFASIANRVSYFFNFQGPSLALDTMCSSSLTSIHLACEAMQRGEIKAAIAGGVNLSIHPSKYIGLSQGKFTSSDGRCRSFGEGGDGYVPGEGVGAVILKPLSLAIRNKDHIYAVIKGTSINHGGKTNGYTVPNPQAQGNLVKLAIDRADIDPRTISYMEAHGTGTSLGDPIEFTGLKRAFAGANMEKQSCPLGSVKSNIGHLEAAAGIAGLTKILLQMKFRKIVPSLHSKVLNPNINFKETPFFVNQKLIDWKQPCVQMENHFQTVPRRAGISSFGAGGSNAHMIVEEFEMPAMMPSMENRIPHVITLSAKNEDRLRAYVGKLLKYLEQFGTEHAGAQEVDEDLLAKIQYGVVRITSSILKVAVQEVDTSEEFLELGLGQHGQAKLLGQLHSRFDIDLASDQLNRCPNIEELALLLYRDHKETFRNHFTNTFRRPDLNPTDLTHINLTAMAYTLQIGREAMPERLAIVVENVAALKEKFAAFLNSESSAGMYRGNVRTQTNASGMLVEGEEGETFLQSVIKKRRYGKIAQLWVSGVSIDWTLLYNVTPHRISLPTYPFDRKRHWIPQKSKTGAKKAGVTSALHPLIDRNISTLSETLLVTEFNTDSQWLDKTKNGQNFLAHALYLEISRAGLATIGETTGLRLQNMRWSDQVLGITQADPKTVQTRLHLLDLDGGKYACEIFSQTSLQRHIHFQTEFETTGRLNFAKDLDLEALKASLVQTDDLAGLMIGDETALFDLGDDLIPDPALVLNPRLVQGAVDAAIRLSGQTGFLQPSAAATLIFRANFNQARFAQVRRQSNKTHVFDVHFSDGDGRILGQWQGLHLQQVTRLEAKSVDHLFASLNWEPTPLSSGENTADQGPWLVFAQDHRHFDAFQSQLTAKGQLTMVIAGDRFAEIRPNIYQLHPGKQTDYSLLLSHLAKQKLLPKHILHLWTVGLDSTGIDLFDQIDTFQKSGSFSVHHLIAALGEGHSKATTSLTIVYPGDAEKGNPILQAMAGFSRSVTRLFPKLTCNTLQIETTPQDQQLAALLMRESMETAARRQADIRYVDGRRLTLKATEIKPATKPQPVSLDGALVISGGAGGLGLLFAHHFAQNPGTKLVLLGRSDLGSQRKAKLSPLLEKGAEVIYLRADVADRASLSSALNKARERFGTIAGVIHAAGRNDETLLTKKPFADFQATLQPKIRGTINLDQLTKADPLQFFVTFSSTSAILGDFGQCDYAIGNRFMDHYAGYREALQAQQARSGRSLSINWPLWRDGGMHLDEATENFYLGTSGMAYLEKDAGLAAFDALLASPHQQALIISGQRPRLRRILGMVEADASQKQPTRKLTRPKRVASSATHGDSMMAELRGLVSELLHIEIALVDIHENLGDFGFDSISLTDFADRLSNLIEVEVTPNLFFTHPTLASLNDYFKQEHKAALAKRFKVALPATEAEPEAADPIVAVTTPAPAMTKASADTGLTPLVIASPQPFRATPLPKPSQTEPVAIIGLAGMFPGSRDVDSFWKNLENQIDLITEIPRNRWDWREFDGDPHGGNRKTDCRWGGFIPDVDQFDARFFQLSPLEANLMDPQHRLFLQTVWKTIEDAGYQTKQLSGRAVGLYVGAQFSDYAELIQGEHATEPFAPTGNVHSILANRVSYLLNLRGPSEPINTACSSALVAIHHAVHAIQSGECEMAIAGAACLMLTPTNLLDASQLSMLAKDGRCKTFDKRADGFVKGEGIGAILLKPLSQAEADGDHIYAVVRGVAVNHGGKATSLTAPNPNAQAELLAQAHQKAGFDPESISYIEMHGTGTALGDPIEIDGLNLAFRTLAKNQGRELPTKAWCKVGSVKTNIGHLEPAAGIAGIIKVLLAMKHQKLPGTLHLKELNPYLKLKDSPFEVVRETQPWQRLTDSKGREIPRRAGVSSFGFGGVNAHIALEEYTQAPQAQVDQACLVVLSARNTDRLRAQARQLAEFVENPDHQAEIRLLDLAFTFQVGRDAMNERLALVAQNIEDIGALLRDYLAGKTEAVASGNAISSANQSGLLLEGREGRTFLQTIISEGKLAKLAKLWVMGVELDWQLLYENLDPSAAPQRISLPTYPFAPEHHWVADAVPLVSGSGLAKPIHPLLHQNQSDMRQICFTTQLSGREFFLADHQVSHQKVLPGVAYLEMAGAAAKVSGGRRIGKINDIVWIKPLAVDDKAITVSVHLEPMAHHTNYQIFSGTGSSRIVHTEGRIVYDTGVGQHRDGERLDLGAIKQRCQATTNSDVCYQRFEAMNLHYGASFRSIQTLWHNQTEALAYLELPVGLTDSFDQFILHPTLLDGALQAVSGLMNTHELSGGSPYIPYALDEIDLLRPMTKACYAHVSMAGNNPLAGTHLRQFNVTITDTSGQQLLRLRDFTLRNLQSIQPTKQPVASVTPPKTAVSTVATNPMLEGFMSEEDEVLI